MYSVTLHEKLQFLSRAASVLTLLLSGAPAGFSPLQAADFNYRMTFEVNYYDWMEKSAAQFTVQENVASRSYKIAISRHRGDIAAAGDSVRLDPVVADLIDFSQYPTDSLTKCLAQSIDSVILRSEAGFTIQKLQGQETVAGLLSEKYSVNDGEGVKYYLWLAELPPDLSYYNELASLSFRQRRSTFLMFEFERQLIRQLLLSGVLPSNPGRAGKGFLVTRIETAKQFGFALSKGNTMSVEMKVFQRIPSSQ